MRRRLRYKAVSLLLIPRLPARSGEKSSAHKLRPEKHAERERSCRRSSRWLQRSSFARRGQPAPDTAQVLLLENSLPTSADEMAEACFGRWLPFSIAPNCDHG